MNRSKYLLLRPQSRIITFYSRNRISSPFRMSTLDRILHPGFVGLLFVAIFLMNCPESSAVKCDLCNGDFVVLGRHRWRCTGPKGRFTSAGPTAPNDDQVNTGQVQPGNNTYTNTAINPAPKCQISKDELIKCVCGRSCKGRRGLRAHQRCCKAAQSLSDQYQHQSADNNISPIIDHEARNVTNDSPDGDTVPPIDDHYNEPIINSPENVSTHAVHENSQPDAAYEPNFKAGIRLPRSKLD